MFLGIYLFSYVVKFVGYFSTVVSYNPFCFCGISHNVYFFISDFIYLMIVAKVLSMLFFFLVIIAKVLSILFFWWILDRGGRWREREMLICCSTYLYIHWLFLVRTLTRDQTHKLGIVGWCSNQLSYLARALISFF